MLDILDTVEISDIYLVYIFHIVTNIVIRSLDKIIQSYIVFLSSFTIFVIAFQSNYFDNIFEYTFYSILNYFLYQFIFSTINLFLFNFFANS